MGIGLRGHNTFQGSVSVSDPTNAVSQSTGALVIEGGMGVGGNIFCGSTFNMSDATLKDNLQTIAHPWDLLDSIRGYTFHWNNHPENERFGRCGDRGIGCRAQDIRDAGETSRLCVTEDPSHAFMPD